MALNSIQQIFELIQKSNNILITFKKNGGGDAMASSLALSFIIKKLSKENTKIVCDNFELSDKFSFLPQAEKIKPALANLKQSVISLDISKNKVSDLKYNVTSNKLNIFLTPDQKPIKIDDLKIHSASFKYDLIFVLDTPDLESLGSIYEQNTEFFFQTPIINIDHLATHPPFL